ncbi:sugar O-acetyltransferase [Corynebacterium kalidii]|uniref:Sugar O-acetyltransferase n=1 Tax=Corynebacterium kalidii TaxID=2931982 RepID=A0A9X2B1A5_9CORY|nr:sugar O-acetyltransferase [Corynebacterium kalidii]MCJ7857505.1 sugar O-acetyltransferase [Corynebacterium kalidii]
MTDAPTADSLRAAADADTRTMWERMVAGDYYLATDPQIAAASLAARSACFHLAQTDPADVESRNRMIRDLLGSVGARTEVWEGLRVDYGTNVHLGDDVFINVDATILDVCPVTVGDRCRIGPGARFLTPLHPLEDHDLRASGWEYGAPITLGRNVWFGGGVTVCAGVTIGDDVVVGAGSVVTLDLPSSVLAAGTPARVIRQL